MFLNTLTLIELGQPQPAEALEHPKMMATTVLTLLSCGDDTLLGLGGFCDRIACHGHDLAVRCSEGIGRCGDLLARVRGCDDINSNQCLVTQRPWGFDGLLHQR
jgi:hypothetical protein